MSSGLWSRRGGGGAHVICGALFPLSTVCITLPVPHHAEKTRPLVASLAKNREGGGGMNSVWVWQGGGTIC